MVSVRDKNMLEVSSFFKDKSVLVTGGTGSFGKRLIELISQPQFGVKKIIIYSRDELKQSDLRLSYPANLFPQFRFFIGDVRDRNRLITACEDVDVIVHAAALKQVDTAEYNPSECVTTNVVGAQNVIDAALKNNVADIVALSTDKASSPVNLYGATKLVSDKLFIAANNIKGQRSTKFSVVRYGNVMGSRGSVIPFFLKQKETGSLPITNPEMTRFNITLKEGVDLILFALMNHLGGEIFIPKIPSYNIMTLAAAIAPEIPTETVGLRPGEKTHEELISATDSLTTIELKDKFVIFPRNSYVHDSEKYLKYYKGKQVLENFTYNSGENKVFETVDTLRKKINKLEF